MKKAILSAAVASSLIALSFSGMALNNPFTQLVNHATNPYEEGKCGSTTDPNFCHCFTKALIEGCKSRGVGKCTDINWLYHNLKAMLDEGWSYERICSKYKPPVSQKECVTDLKYWYTHYPACAQP